MINFIMKPRIKEKQKSRTKERDISTHPPPPKKKANNCIGDVYFSESIFYACNNAEKYSGKPIKDSERLLDFDKYVLSEEFGCHLSRMENLFSFRFDFYGYLYYLLILMENSVNGNQWNIWNTSVHLILHCPDAYNL